MPRPSAPWHSAQPRVSKRYLPCLSAAAIAGEGDGNDLDLEGALGLARPQCHGDGARRSRPRGPPRRRRSRKPSGVVSIRHPSVGEAPWYPSVIMAGVMGTPPHGPIEPSQWVARWAASIRPGGAVLDVAAGGGRHAKWLARMGFEVDAVDRDLSAFGDAPANVRLLEADIESGPWPYEGRRFDAIVVTNYLHRPLLPRLAESLERGRPSRVRDLRAGQRALRQAFESGVPAGAGRVAGGRARAPAGARLRGPGSGRAAAGGDPANRGAPGVKDLARAAASRSS